MHISRTHEASISNHLVCDQLLTRKPEHLSEQVGRLTHLLSAKDSEAERRLGAVEYELEQYKRVTEALRAEYEHKLSVSYEQVQQLQLELAGAQNEAKRHQDEMGQMAHKLEHLESYLAHLPTVEEYESTMKQLQTAERRVVDLQNRADQTGRELQSCEQRLGGMAVKVQRSTEREALLQTQLDEAMQRLGFKSANDTNPRSSKVTVEFVEDLKFERDRYKTAFDQTKKLLEAETHRAEAAEARQTLDKRQFQERLAREEATIAGLKATLSNRCVEMDQLRKTISQLHVDKQELTSKLLSVRAELSKASTMWKSTSGRKRLRLSRELKDAVCDLQDLAEHMQQLAMGEKLDLASLLSQPVPLNPILNVEELVDSIPELAQLEDPNQFPAVQMLFADGLADSDFDALLRSVHDARKTLAQLRQQLTDRYADHLGGKLDCMVQ